MSKLKKFYNFGLELGTYGVATDQEIQEMCRDLNTKIYKKELSSYQDVLEWQSMAGDIEPGIYQIADGIIEVTGSEEDFDIILIPRLKIVV